MARILIFEDDARLAAGWRDAFEANGHEVWLTEDVSEALRTVGKERIHLVIFDMMIVKDGKLSSEGGLTLISRLRLHHYRRVKSIAISGDRGGPHRTVTLLKAAEDWADLTLEKPIPVTELVARAEAILAEVEQTD